MTSWHGGPQPVSSVLVALRAEPWAGHTTRTIRRSVGQGKPGHGPVRGPEPGLDAQRVDSPRNRAPRERAAPPHTDGGPLRFPRTL